MSGIIVPIVEQYVIDYSFLDASATAGVIFEKALNVIPYKSGRLLTQLHAIDFHTGGGQTLDVNVYGAYPSRRDPQDFGTATAIMTTQLTNTDAAGDLASDTDSDLYPYLEIGVMGTQGSTGQAKFYAVISIGVLLRVS